MSGPGEIQRKSDELLLYYAISWRGTGSENEIRDETHYKFGVQASRPWWLMSIHLSRLPCIQTSLPGQLLHVCVCVWNTIVGTKRALRKGKWPADSI